MWKSRGYSQTTGQLCELLRARTIYCLLFYLLYEAEGVEEGRPGVPELSKQLYIVHLQHEHQSAALLPDGTWAYLTLSHRTISTFKTLAIQLSVVVAASVNRNYDCYDNVVTLSV